MKKLVLVLGLGLLVLAKSVWACSVSVDDNYQKNLLAAHGASHLDIALTTVSSTKIEEYGRTLIGEDSYYCPLYLETRARVSFKYSPGKFQHCDASVVVVRKQVMSESAEGPFEELSYSELTAACSTSLPRLPERRIPRIPCLPGRSC